MTKKMIAATTLLVAVLTTAAPAYAQSPTPTGSPGFFGEIENFFNGFFQHKSHSAPMGQNQQEGQNQSTPSGTAENSPSGVMQPNPSGMPDYSSMQQRRLAYLVQQGKITQAQSDAILAELQKVQTELKTWADSEGISEQYVLGGPIGQMGQMRQSQDVQQGGFQNSGTQQGDNQQFHPMMHQGQGGQQGFQGEQEGPGSGPQGGSSR